MSTPLPTGNETTAQASQSTLQWVKITGDPGDADHLDPSDFPEGGVKAWSTALGAFLIQFCGAGFTTSYGVFQDFYARTYLTDYTPSAIAWIGAVNALLIFSVGLVSGRLLDRGIFRLSSPVSLPLYAVTSEAEWIFLSQGIGSGVAIGLTNVPSVAVVSHHFQRRRTLVMALVITGPSIGAILQPIMLNNLINGGLGFANGVRVSAGMISGLLLIAYFLMHTRLPPQPKAISYTRVLQNSWRDRPYVCACLGMAAFDVGLFFMLFYLQLDSRLHGLSEVFTFYSLTIFHTGSLMGRLTAGVVSAYVGIPNTVVGCSVISSAIVFSMIGLRSVTSAALIGMSYGYFSGGFIALIAPLISYLTPEDLDIGVRIGISFAMTGIGSLFGAPICGAVLTSHYIWWRPAVLAGSITTCGTIFFVSMQLILKFRQKTAGGGIV
ncbi:major facilitator superfamily domain-containing protein [Suillus subalutaceus]|uniref:major facilitator superfamily domain-containing protein n=1 Tax=Suillus subalutaceus TaxID=48586 RepID=UPI001B86D3B4|nr:major facilitator superfamily domain-containing protein [Suillus subalutaceus]KAG1836288.1 major facilitator superfamily domain-containing protein [Suillus subalutaceus]